MLPLSSGLTLNPTSKHETKPEVPSSCSLKMPLVSEQVKSLGMPWELVLTKWLMCLFADVLPTDTALRVWDCLFYEGSKILIRVALAIVAMAQEQIAAATSMADLVQIFKDAVGSNSVVNCHEFMSVNNFQTILSLIYVMLLVIHGPKGL